MVFSIFSSKNVVYPQMEILMGNMMVQHWITAHIAFKSEHCRLACPRFPTPCMFQLCINNTRGPDWRVLSTYRTLLLHCLTMFLMFVWQMFIDY